VLGQIAELDCLDPQILRQQRLVLPNFADHRLGRLALEEELHDLLGLGADDAKSTLSTTAAANAQHAKRGRAARRPALTS
jgi:hypothetical protein